MSKRAAKRAAHMLLTTGCLPAGFAKLLREVGTDETRALISDARKLRAETFLAREARKAALVQVTREVLLASRLSWRDKGSGNGALTWRK